MTTQQLFIALFSATLLITSCQKNGKFQENLAYSEINVAWNYNPYPGKRFSVEVDGVNVTDTLMYQSANYNYTIAIKRILGGNNPKRFILKDAEAGTVALDTMIKLVGRTKVRLLALSAADKPVIAGESELPANPLNTDSAKYTFIYNDPKLPDSILLRLHYGDEANLPVYEPAPFDSVVIKKNEFSRYVSFPFNNFRGNLFYFTILNAKTKELIQDIDGNTYVGLAYGIYQGGNLNAPTIYKFSKVLIRYADPNETDELKKDRFYDEVIGVTAW